MTQQIIITKPTYGSLDPRCPDSAPPPKPTRLGRIVTEDTGKWVEFEFPSLKKVAEGELGRHPDLDHE